MVSPRSWGQREPTRCDGTDRRAREPLSPASQSPYLRPWLGLVDEATFYPQMAQFDQHWPDEIEPLLRRVAEPMRLLWGADGTADGTADDTESALVHGHKLAERRGTGLFVIQHAGHLVQNAAPEAVVATILRLPVDTDCARRDMRVLVTGSSGHLGEALMRLLPAYGHWPVGIDVLPGPYTTAVGSITDHDFVRRHMAGTEAVIHAAALHKPHVATHTKQDFVDANLSGTLVLLEAALAAGLDRFVFSSTTSAFGDALTPPAAAPAAWIDEVTSGAPKNIYGVTKTAAEDLCHLFHRRHGLNVIVLRVSRFFPEEDDDRTQRETYDDRNLKANEFLFRRVDVSDAATAHIAAAEKALALGFGRYVISATTPFRPDDTAHLRRNAPAVVRERVGPFDQVYETLGFRMFPSIDRVYANHRARRDLGWAPDYDFAHVLDQLAAGEAIGSTLAHAIGRKGYHTDIFADGPYPVA